MNSKLSLRDKDLYFAGDETGHGQIYFRLYRGNEEIYIEQLQPNEQGSWTESELFYEGDFLTEEMKSMLLKFFNSDGPETWRKNKIFLKAINKLLKM